MRQGIVATAVANMLRCQMWAHKGMRRGNSQLPLLVAVRCTCGMAGNMRPRYQFCWDIGDIARYEEERLVRKLEHQPNLAVARR